MPFLPLPPRTVARGGGRGLLVNSIHGVDTLRYVVVLYRLSTSNHNLLPRLPTITHIVLYRLSTSNHNPTEGWESTSMIVLYCLSTSNHNFSVKETFAKVLSYIVFLHQTTTCHAHRSIIKDCLILSFYIKPQHSPGTPLCRLNCLILSFYIKPQPAGGRDNWSNIVLYCLSTSNHNVEIVLKSARSIVLYCLSTSNHN